MIVEVLFSCTSVNSVLFEAAFLRLALKNE
jgi:hypothetical protein